MLHAVLIELLEINCSINSAHRSSEYNGQPIRQNGKRVRNAFEVIIRIKVTWHHEQKIQITEYQNSIVVPALITGRDGLGGANFHDLICSFVREVNLKLST